MEQLILVFNEVDDIINHALNPFPYYNFTTGVGT